MSRPLREELAETARETVPFLLIVLVWTVVTLALYGIFLATKPGNVDYTGRQNG